MPKTATFLHHFISYAANSSLCRTSYAYKSTPTTFYVVDANGNISDIGTEGLYRASWQFDDRWVILSKLKLNSTSGPTPWVVWHIEQADADKWHQSIRHEFTPTPYNFDFLDLRFENGVATMIADLEYWWQDDPCQFSAEFQESYAHGDWKTRETYALVEGAYQRTDVQIIDFPLIDKATQTSVTLNDWQTHCLNPLFSN